MRLLIFISTGLLAIWGTSCNNNPVFPIEPQIEYIDIQPRQVQEIVDSLYITLEFTDGDGDLGDDIGGIRQSITVRDNRAFLPDSVTTLRFSMPDLKTNARNPSIQGRIFIILPPAVIWPRSELEQTTSFSITITDRAGNESNTVTTDEILITR